MKCRKNTESKNPKVVKKPGRIMILSNCAVCGCKTPRFIKEQEASGIQGNLLGTKIPVLGNLPLTNI